MKRRGLVTLPSGAREETMDWADIPKEAYGLAGAAIGGGISIITTFFNQRRQRKLEREKLREGRKDALLRELGTCFRTVAVDFSSAAHSMCWLTWQADHGNMTQKMIDDYNAEIHAILPKLIGGKIMIGALDPELGDQLDLFVDLTHEVDEKIGIACLTYAKDNAAGLEQLKALNVTARDLDEIIYKQLGGLGRGKHTLGKWIIRRWSALRARKKLNLH
jgi:hypothetical protein